MPREKLDALTGLRFIAAMMIVVHHARGLGIAVPEIGLDHAVSLFFSLSGFVLAYNYRDLDLQADSLGRFYALRLARIWPAYLMSLFLVVLVFGMSPDGIFFANLFMLQAWVPMMPWYFSYSAPSWSISVEMFFYLLFPFLIFGWAKTWWWKLLLSAGMVVALMAIGPWLGMAPGAAPKPIPTLHGLLYINPLARTFEFVVGIAACSVFLWLRDRTRSAPPWSFTLAEFAALAIAVYSVAFNPIADYASIAFGDGPWSDWLPHTGGMVVFAGLIVVFALGRGVVSRLLAAPLLILLGEISYSIYLIHQTTFRAYVTWFGPRPSGIVAFAACVAATVVLSLLVWRFVEVPCRGFVKRRVGAQADPKAIQMATTG